MITQRVRLPVPTRRHAFTHIASWAVYFDFLFKIDGKDENRAWETWPLVKAVDGRRIAAISYSSDPVRQQ